MSAGPESPWTGILPPGMTPQGFLALENQLVKIGICNACGFAVILWDYLVTFKDEWTLYTVNRRSTWRHPSAFAFILLRYASIAATLSSIFFTAVQTDRCDLAVGFSGYGAAIVVASASFIFGSRVVALWKGNKIVYAIIALAYLVTVASWFAVASTYSVVTGPPTLINSNCQLQPVAVWNPISFGSSVMFDIVVLILTLLKLRSQMDMRSAVGRRLYRDSMTYFVITTITNLVVLIINALPNQFALIKPAVEPFSTVITSAMAQRVYLNLKLFYQRKEGNMDVSLQNMSTPPPHPSVGPFHSSLKQDSTFVSNIDLPIHGHNAHLAYTRETVVTS